MKSEFEALDRGNVFDLNPESDSIQDLLRKMSSLEYFFNQNDSYSSFSEFLEVYKQITLSVEKIYVRNEFQQASEMERLDIEFASYYFDAMEKFLFHEERVEPWKKYIDYCMRDDASASIAMFLGINSHVNGDLVKALNHTEFDSYADYNRVNPVLKSHLSKNLRHLVLKDHDKYAFLAALFKPLSRYELDSTVISWRRNAWNRRGNHGIEATFEDYAEKVAEKVIGIAHATNPLTLPYEAYRLHDIRMEDFPEIESEINSM